MFTAIDDAIVTKIGQGRTQFLQLSLNSELESLAAPLAAGLRSPAWRVMDRRLQALRKAGRIAYDRKAGWSVLPNKSGLRIDGPPRDGDTQDCMVGRRMQS